jgi:predicted CopG family antitoxin
LLKVAIVYLQGSGGNLLSRTLALSEKTVAYLPAEYSQQQPRLKLSAQQRFLLYNNWNPVDWPGSETTLRIWYHAGLQDFVNYENSDLWLIDHFHPEMFKFESDRKLLWDNINSWEQLIFIKYQSSSIELIKQLAKLKRSDLDHVRQIEQTELETFDKLQSDYQANIVHWEHMLEKDSYVDVIHQLSQKLDLDLDLALVAKLWQSWKTATDKLLDE